MALEKVFEGGWWWVSSMPRGAEEKAGGHSWHCVGSGEGRDGQDKGLICKEPQGDDKNLSPDAVGEGDPGKGF